MVMIQAAPVEEILTTKGPPTTTAAPTTTPALVPTNPAPDAYANDDDDDDDDYDDNSGDEDNNNGGEKRSPDTNYDKEATEGKKEGENEIIKNTSMHKQFLKSLTQKLSNIVKYVRTY